MAVALPALSSSAFLVPRAEKLMGKPVSMQISALLGNDPRELPEDGRLPAPPHLHRSPASPWGSQQQGPEPESAFPSSVSKVG